MDAAHIAAELQFDKRLAQASLAVDGLADALVALTPASSQTLFIGLSCLSSFTSGGNPTLHSLGAVCLHACGYSSEVGALFGGMAVLSAIAHIINVRGNCVSLWSSLLTNCIYIALYLCFDV